MTASTSTTSAGPSTTPGPLASPMPWDLVADAYDAKVRPLFEAYALHALARAAPAQGARVADVACGPGTLALLAYDAGHDVDALDFSPAMIERLVNASRARAAEGRLRAVVGDGQALPWPDASFEAAFSMFGLMFFPDRARGYAELRRVLAPGGRAVVASWASLGDVPFLASIFAALAEAEPSLAGPSGRPPLTTADAHVAEMSAAGFGAIEVDVVRHATPPETPRGFWAEFQETSAPIVLMRRRVGEARWAPIADHVADRLAARWGDAPLTVEFPALVGIGTRA